MANKSTQTASVKGVFSNSPIVLKGHMIFTGQALVGKMTSSAKVPKYEGEYDITPSTNSVTLATASKMLTDNITVQSIPYFEVTNPTGGTTAVIG